MLLETREVHLAAENFPCLLELSDGDIHTAEVHTVLQLRSWFLTEDWRDQQGSAVGE